MKTEITIGVLDNINNCDFTIVVPPNTDIEKVKRLAIEGMDAWYAAAAGPGETIEPTEHFSADEIASFYYLGYAEPTSILLTRFGIEHTINDMEFTPDGNAICNDIVWY